MTEAVKEVYDAINMADQHKDSYPAYFILTEFVKEKYEIYKKNGGKLDLKYFKDTLSDYLVDGYCGY